jgi:hypothetical protein
MEVCAARWSRAVGLRHVEAVDISSRRRTLKRTGSSPTRVAVTILVTVAAALAGCSDDHAQRGGWTVEQAKAVTTIRGMRVRVIRCRGIGKSDGTPRYKRFVCEAGTRRPSDTIDTVGIHYEIRVRNSSEHELENVEFYGGPGIP